jgi:hypothetical protein
MKPIIQSLWATDFDALSAKLMSMGKFAMLVVTGCSVAANALPKYERIARPKLRWFWMGMTKVVALGALNWRKRIPSMDWHIGAMKDEPKTPRKVEGYD